jgi:hypothetical protein
MRNGGGGFPAATAWHSAILHPQSSSAIRNPHPHNPQSAIRNPNPQSAFPIPHSGTFLPTFSHLNACVLPPQFLQWRHVLAFQFRN